MQLSFEYNNRKFEFELNYKKRKTLQISIIPPDRIIVSAPVGLTPNIVIERVRSKAEWIIKKLVYFRELNYNPVEREFVDGETFLYLGQEYPLKVQVDRKLEWPAVKITGEELVISAPVQERELIRTTLAYWYQSRAEDQVRERVSHYQGLFAIRPSVVRAKEQKRRWGSCTPTNGLLFNWRLVMAPLPVIDYVVVHELCHLVHKNHSQQFWDLVASITPDYLQRRKWLKNNGMRLEI